MDDLYVLETWNWESRYWEFRQQHQDWAHLQPMYRLLHDKGERPRIVRGRMQIGMIQKTWSGFLTAFKALGSSHGVEVYRLLLQTRKKGRGLTMKEIGRHLGIPQPAVSLCISKLSAAGLLNHLREGPSILCSPSPASTGWIETLFEDADEER